jgi:DNA-binding XRE family transcriptional regulator
MIQYFTGNVKGLHDVLPFEEETLMAYATSQGQDMPVTNLYLPHLRAWRLHRLLSQTELARRSLVSRPTILRAEKGKGPIGALTAERLAQVLQVSVRQLQEEEPMS